jgi:hypothetical protein
MAIGAHPEFEIQFVPPKGHRARKLALFILTLAPFAFGLLALILGQDANWDLRNYHWYNAYAFLNGRYNGLDLLPSQTPYFYNPALDVPFFLLANEVPARVAAFVLGTVQGLNFPLLFMLGHASIIVPNARHKVLTAAGLAALGLLGGGGIAQIGTTFYDNVTSLGVFLAALLVLGNLKTLIEGKLGRALPLAFFAGVPAGLMMGLKLPSVIFAVGLCFGLLFLTGSFRRRVMLSFFFGLGVLAGCAVTLGPWAVFLETHYGSPLFPYFNNFFHAPLAPDSSARDTQFVPIDWHDRLLFPFIFARYPLRVGEIPWSDLRLPLLYALLPVAVVLRLLFGKSRGLHDKIAYPLPARYLLWVSVIAYAVWVGMFAIYRYALPLEMLTPLLILFTVNMLPLHLPTRGLIAAFLLVAIAVTIQPGNWTRRDAWLDHFVEADIPKLPNDPSVMLLMAGYEPYSHLIPLFPPAMPVVRIQSNFTSPEISASFSKSLHDRIDAHKGSFKILIPANEKEAAQKPLSLFKLTLLPQTCQKVVDHLYEATYALCDVQRQP